MALTTEQSALLRADILADPVLSTFPPTSDSAFEIAAAYNVDATPVFYVWKSSVAVAEIMQNGFDWTRVDNMTANTERIWRFMIEAGVLNPSKANVRAGMIAAFRSGADIAMRTAIFANCQRAARRIEKLLATGTGTASTDQGVGPALLGFEGTISFIDVKDAMGW